MFNDRAYLKHTYDVTRPYTELASRSTVSEPGTTASSARTLGEYSITHFTVPISSHRAGTAACAAAHGGPHFVPPGGAHRTDNHLTGPDTSSQPSQGRRALTRALTRTLEHFVPFSVLLLSFHLMALAKSTEFEASQPRSGLGMWATIRKTAGDVPVAGRRAEAETYSRAKGDGW